MELKSEGETIWLQSIDDKVKTGWIFTDGIQFGNSKFRPSFEIEIGNEKGEKTISDESSIRIIFAGENLFDRLDATIFETVKQIPGIFYLEGDGIFRVPNTGSGVLNWAALRDDDPKSKNGGHRASKKQEIERIGDLPFDLKGTVAN